MSAFKSTNVIYSCIHLNKKQLQKLVKRSFFFLSFLRADVSVKLLTLQYVLRKMEEKKNSAYLLHTMEMAMRETMKTTPAAADPAIRGSCSLNSDLKSSGLHKEKDKRVLRLTKKNDSGSFSLFTCILIMCANCMRRFLT